MWIEMMQVASGLTLSQQIVYTGPQPWKAKILLQYIDYVSKYPATINVTLYNFSATKANHWTLCRDTIF